MLDRARAEQIAAQEIKDPYATAENQAVIIEDATIEKDYGWIFFYQSKRYLTTGEMRHRLAGNGPILIEKDTGAVRRFGSACAPEEYIEEYERERATRE